MQQQGYATYRQVSLATASKPQLLLALYDGAVRFVHRARGAVEAKDYETANTCIVRAQEIIGELMSTLDMRYGEVPEQLMEANVRKDGERLAEVDGIVRQLRDAWRVAVQEARETPPAPAAGQAG